MGGDQHRDPRRLHELHERLENVIGGVRIEVSGRLVREQHPRRIGHGARDGDALLFAAGQFGRPVRDALAETEIGRISVERLMVSERLRPRIICGIMTFSSAVNSGSSRCD